MENHPIFLGETSMKSGPDRRYILSLFPDAQIAVTQPRRMAAVNLAKRVAKVGWGGPWRYLQFMDVNGSFFF